MKKYTIDQFREQYPTDDVCLHKIFTLKYGDMSICPKCERDNKFVRVKNRRSYQCPSCGFQLYPTAGTIFDKTTTPLIYWFYAIYLQTTTRNGVAAKELERQLNICYKTALRMAHQIKKLMASDNEKLSGVVELDETYVGGLHRNMHKKKRDELNKLGTGSISKTPVFAMLQRGDGKIAVYVLNIQQINGRTLQPIIIDNVEQGAKIITDNHGAYVNLKDNFDHSIVQHEKGEYVRDKAHTNTVEGFFSILKRTIKGTHIHVSKEHMQKYVDEVAFRYLHKSNQDTMFESVLNRIVA